MSKQTKYCSVFACKNSSINKTIRFFSFPREKDKSRQQKWLEFCNNPALQNLAPSTLVRYKFVCSRHFGMTQYVNILEPMKSRLKTDAVLTIRGFEEKGRHETA